MLTGSYPEEKDESDESQVNSACLGSMGEAMPVLFLAWYSALSFPVRDRCQAPEGFRLHQCRGIAVRIVLRVDVGVP